MRTRDRERKLLRKVQQSIASQLMLVNTVGVRKLVSQLRVPRLMARPTATLSLEAQQRRELKAKVVR